MTNDERVEMFKRHIDDHNRNIEEYQKELDKDPKDKNLLFMINNTMEMVKKLKEAMKDYIE